MANSAVVGLLRVILTANAAEFETAMGRASASAAKWSKDFNKMGAEATRIGSALTKSLTLPLVAVGAGAAKLAIDFESAFAGVRKTVDATEPEFAAMAQAFRDLAKEIPVPVTELARLGEAAGALGIPKAEIVDFSRVMALLGTTTNVTADQAAESIAQIQTQFRSAGKNTENFASALVHLGNNGASTEQQILGLAARLASAGNAAGMSQADVLGFSAAMANVGIDAEAGGTALSRTFNEINVAVAKGGQELEGFARVAGLSAEQFAEKFRTDAAGAVELFIQGLGRVHQEGGNLIATMEELGIKEIRQSDTLRRLALNTENVTKALQDARKGWSDNSALAEEARKRFETTASQLQLLWQKISDVGITLGNALLPSIEAAIKGFDSLLPLVDGMVKAFGELPAPVQAAAVGLGLVAAAAGPVIWGIGQLLSSMGAIAVAFKEGGVAAKALGLAAEYLGPALAAIATPVGVVVAAIAGLAIAWASFKDDWTRAFDVLIPPLGIFRAGIEGVQASLEPYKQQIEDIATIIRGVWNAAWTAATRILADFKDRALRVVHEAFERIAPVIQRVADTIKGALPFAIEVAKAALAPFIASLNLLLAAEAKLRGWSESGKKSLHDMAEAFRAAEAAGKPLQATSLAGAESFAQLAASAGQASSAVQAAAPAVQGMTAQLKAVRAEVAAFSAEQVREVAAGREMGLSTKEITEALNKQYPSLKASEAAVEMLTERLKENEKAADKAAAAQKKLDEQAKKFAASVNQNLNFAPLAAGLQDTEAGLQAVGASLHDLPSGTLHETALATEAARKETEKWAEETGGKLVPAVKAVGSAADETKPKILSLGQSLKAALGDLPSVIMKTLQGGGDLGKSIGGLFGANVFGENSGLVKGLTGKLSGVLGKTIGGALGSILPGLGTMLGAGLGSIAGKFFGKLFGGGEQKKVNDLRDKFIGAAGGLHELNAKAQAAGLTLDRLLRAKSVKEYEAAISELQGAFDRLAENKDKAVGLFDQIMDAGRTGIPAAFRPAIEQLISLGLLTDEQAAKLRELGDGAVVDVDKMRSAMELLNGRVESLGPAFRQAEIDKTAKTYIDAIDTLIKGGGDVGGILFDAREEISALVVDARKFGTTLPANMQPWIAELERAGLLLDENGNKIADTTDLKYGEAMKTEAEIAEQGWNDILAAIRDLIDEIRGPLAGAINDLPTERHVRIVYDVDPAETGAEADARGYQEGTKGRLGDWWGNFKSGTDTRLHGWEAVVTPDQAVPFSLATLEPLLSRLAPAGGPAGGDTTNTTSNNVALVVAPEQLDAGRIADRVFAAWPSAMQADRFGMLSAIERAIEDYQRTYGHG